MRKILIRAISTLFFVLGLNEYSTAALYDRGNGLIYDDVLDITWLQDANYALTSGYAIDYAVNNGITSSYNIFTDGRMGWNAALEWADNLIYQGFNSWRLPTMMDTGSPGCNNAYYGTDCGYNVQTGNSATTIYSELASLYYDTLGNEGRFDANGVFNPDWSLPPNAGPFVNLLQHEYWFGLEYAAYTIDAWDFLFDTGHQSRDGKVREIWVWAVHNGDIGVVPIPAALPLFGSALGLMGFVGWRKRKQTS